MHLDAGVRPLHTSCSGPDQFALQRAGTRPQSVVRALLLTDLVIRELSYVIEAGTALHLVEPALQPGTTTHYPEKKHA
jgi:hypothetical protein